MQLGNHNRGYKGITTGNMSKFYLYIALLNLFDLLAILSGKFWNLTGKPIYMAGCIAGFGMAAFFFALSLKYEGVAITNVLWIGLSIVLVTLMGVFVFHETITPWQWAGMGAVLLGIVMLNVR